MDLAHDTKSPGKRGVLSGLSPEHLLRLRRYAWTLPVLGIVGLGLIGFLLGTGPLLLALAALALAAAIFLIWNSLLALSEETEPRVEDALTLWESSVEDERKQAVLRALKDLDYEHAVGKLADDDYQRLRARYRAEARALLNRSGTDDAELERANRVLEQRLQRLGQQRAERPAEPASEPPVSPPEAPAATPPPSDSASEPPAATRHCEACQTDNDADARFCKGCGAPLSPVRSAD